MPTVRFRQKKKLPSAEDQFKIIRFESRKQLELVAKEHVKQREEVVKDFTNKPEFDYVIDVGQKIFGLRILLTNGNQRLTSGSGTIRDLVKWLFKTGTKPHKIKPKKPGGILSFPWGGPGSYSRRTSTRGKGRGSGTVSGAVATFRPEVDHPGTQKSNEFDKINQRLKRLLLKQADEGIRRGLKRIGRK